MITKTTDGTRQTHAVEVFFAKSIDGVRPGTLGSSNATADGTQYQNHLLAHLMSEEEGGNNASFTDNTFMQSLMSNNTVLKQENPPNIVLQGEPDTGDYKGYSKIYIGILSIDGSPNFASTVQCDGVQAAGGKTLTVKTTSALTNFGIGDVLIDEDDRLLGTVKSVDSATSITLTSAGLQNATVNNKDVYTKSPMRLQLSLER